MKNFIFFVSIIFIFNIYIYAQNENKKEDIFTMKVIGALSNDVTFTNNKDVGFWGFSDESIDKQYFSGYLYGMILSFRFSEYFDLFMDITILRSSLLMGKAGSRLKGIAVWDADPNHTSTISPPLSNDIYFISKATMGRIGIRVIYPVNNIFEPYVGLAAGIVPYEIAFGNQDGSRAYSDIINEVAPIYALIVGSDLKMDVLTLGLFLEIGGAASESGTIMGNWLWQGWTYHAQFPIVPAYRVGLTLGFNI